MVVCHSPSGFTFPNVKVSGLAHCTTLSGVLHPRLVLLTQSGQKWEKFAFKSFCSSTLILFPVAV